MTDRDALLTALAASPADWHLRKVLADWYEENGLPPQAECLRWMVREKKRPRLFGGGRGWWYDQRTKAGGDPESDLPDPLFEEVVKAAPFGTKLSAGFPSMRDAEEAILEAWARARRGGWDPAAAGERDDSSPRE